MKFDFVKSKCSDLGLVVKHGNSDNVVFFFDENEDAACYKLRLFRTNLVANNESFIIEDSIKSDDIKYLNRDRDKLVRLNNNHIENNPNNLCFKNKELFVQIKRQIKSVTISINGNQSYFYDYEYFDVLKEKFSEVKFITTIESDRNNLYFNVNFLPCGQYLAILDIENRSGEVFETSIPYYFVIKQKSEKDLIDAIHGVGRAAAGHTVVI